MHLAARFCAKEAVAKALGLSAWSYRDVEVVAGDGAPVRAPERRARRSARRSSGVEPVVSLTHTQALAGAVALLR